MTGSAFALDLPVARPTRAPSMLRIYRLEAWYEFLKMLRQPSYALPTLGFPVMFYLIFGIALGGRGPRGMNLAEYLIASYGAFGIVGAAMFGFGVGVAAERAQGWLLLKRVSPMPPAAFITAKIVMSAVFGLMIVLLMGACGFVLGGVRLPLAQCVHLATVLVVGTVPFCLIGLVIGSLVSAASAPGVVNLIHLPLAFASGLAMPIEVMPTTVQRVAQLLPQYHLGQLALGTIGRASDPDALRHIVALAAFTALFGLAAVWAHRRAA